MKNLVFKYRILIIILILIFFLIIPIERINAAAENYFFIGDSRTYHMMTYYASARGSFDGKVINQSAIDSAGYVGTTWDNWFSSNGSSRSKLNALSSAPTGTKVIIWLGVNDVRYNDHGTPAQKADLYVQEIKKLANTYKNLMFCQVSVTAVYEPQATSTYTPLLNNTRIDQFNSELKSKISSANMDNYTYIDINSELKSYITSNNPTVGDGLHYTSTYYRTISDKIYAKVSKINYIPDTTPPSLSSINVTSPAGGVYKAGTKITFVSTYSENIYGNASKTAITSSTAPKLTVKFGSGAAKTATFSSVSGKTITYTYTIQDGDSGKLVIAGHTGNVYDSAGNKLSVGTKTIGGNSITADTTQPNCTITASTGNTTNASSITYTFTWSETLANNTFTVDDITVTNGTKGEFKIVTANKVYTLVVKNTGSCEQTVSVAANKCTDSCGNPNKLASKSVTIDRTAPTLEVTKNPTSWTKSDVTLTIKAGDTSSKLKNVTVDGTDITLDSNGQGTYKVTKNGTYKVVATDTVGNTKEQLVTVSNIDKTAPTLEVTKNPTSWTKSDVTLTIKAGDDESGVNNVTVDGKKVTLSNGKYEYKVSNNGTYKVVVTDKVGNTKEQSVTVSNIDKTAPTIEVTKNPENLTKDDVTLTIKAEDKESGVNNVTVDGTAITLDSNGQGTYKVTKNGTYKVVATDTVGNTKEQSVTVSNIDKTAPTLEVTKNPTSWTKSDVTLTIKAGDTASKLKNVTVDGTAITLDSNGQGTYKVTKNGTYKVIATDTVGNTKEQSVTVSNIDKTAPTLEVTKNPTSWTKSDVTLTINAEDKESGINNVTVDGKKVTLSNGKYEYRVTKNGTYKVVVTDKAGNTKEQSVIVSNIDKTGLTCEVEYSTTNPTNGNVKVTIKTNKEVSAIDGWTLSKDKKELTKTYSSNKEEQVTLKDSLGNSAIAKIKITNIDKIAPTLEVTGNPTSWTKSDVILTIKAGDAASGLNSVIVDGTVITIDSNGQGTYKVTKNGTYKVVVTDRAGNTKEETVIVSKIDKTVPVINNVTKTPETWTSGGVTIKVEAEDKESGIKEYSFDGGKKWQTKNQKTYNKNTNGIIIKVKDKAENIKEYGEEINITNIKDMTDVIEIKDYTLGNNMLEGIKPGTTLEKIKENIIIKDQSKVKILNKQNKEIAKGEKITTGSKVQINAFGEIVEYKIVVTGDTTGDGQADFNDMMKVNLHRLNKIELEGEYFEAGDVNKDGKVDFTDFIKINLYRLKKIDIL